MRYIETEELKKIQLDMLKSIDAFCRKNGIRYSLAFGSLLGAVRHKGYIPWDDDIDIMIPREDYTRFVNTYKDGALFVADLSTVSEYELPYAKVFHDATVMEEDARAKKQFGIYIDVFPIDVAPDNENELTTFLRKKKCLNILFLLKQIRISKHRSFLKNILLLFSHIVLAPISLRGIAKRMDKCSKMYSNSNTKKQGIIAPADNRVDEIFPSYYFEEYTSLPFESTYVMAISRYEEYLVGSYGDYMNLPPREKQVSHHRFKAWWKE